MLPAADFLALPDDKKPAPVIVWGPLDLLAMCLANGAVDALTLPLDQKELDARIVGRFSRAKALVSGLCLDPAEERAYVILSLAEGSVVSRHALEWALWGAERPGSRRLDMVMSGLRRKLTHAKKGPARKVLALRNKGYLLQEQVVDNL